jgi:hypothetical protein
MMWEYVALVAVALTVIAYVVNSLYDWGRLPVSGARDNPLRKLKKYSSIGSRNVHDERRAEPSSDWPPSGTALNPQEAIRKTDRKQERRESQES